MSEKKKAYEEISPRLLGLREALDLSLEEFAAKVNVSVDEVRRYESGQAEIPVSYLFEVGQACNVDTTSLITGGEAHLHGYALVRKAEGVEVTRRKDYQYRSLAHKFSKRVMEPFVVCVPAKEVEDMNFQAHNGQEFIYIIDGKLELRLGSDVLVLEPGDSIYFDSRIPHALRGLDGNSAQFIDVIV